MILEDIGTISPSGRTTIAYLAVTGRAYVEVPNDHPKPQDAAQRAMMLFLAEIEQKSHETIIQTRSRIRDYLIETPLVVIGSGTEVDTGLKTIIYAEAW